MVSEGSGPAEQYRILPEMLSTDGTFHEETIDSCLSLFPSSAEQAQDLSPVKSQQEAVVRSPVQRQTGSVVANLQSQPGDFGLPLAAPPSQTSLQALFEAASNELVASGGPDTFKSGCAGQNSQLVFSSPGTSVSPSCSSPARPPSTTASQRPLPQIRPAHCAMVDSKQGRQSLSQGKLRVINQGIQSENIQCNESRGKVRRRSGQVVAAVHPHLPSSQPGPATACTSSLPVPHPPPPPARVRLLSVGPEVGPGEAGAEQSPTGSDSEVDTDSSNGPQQRGSGLATPGLWSSAEPEIWSHNKSWTHPVEVVDTAVPASGAVWQLPGTPSTKQAGQPWLEGGVVSQQPDLTISTTTIPWNTPVSLEPAKWENSGGAAASAQPASVARASPPGVVSAVSWTQPQSSASPSPVQLGPGPACPGQLVPQPDTEIELSTSSPATLEPGPPGLQDQQQAPGPSWRSNLGSEDAMLAIRSGIPLAFENKAIRSGVPIGPFQNKRKRKSRCSQDASKAKKKPTIVCKKGDLEVRKDLTIESQKNNEDLAIENVFQTDESSASTSNIVSTKTKEESTLISGEVISVHSPKGGTGSVQIKTVKKLNSDAAVSEFPMAELNSMGESSKTDKYQYSCVNCSMMFSSAGQLKRHTQNAHGKEETLFCQVCPERCQGKENLKLHLYKTHGIGEMFRCEECNYESPVKSVYIKHLSEHIPQEAMKKKCPKCPKTFRTKTGLNMHLKQHFDESLHGCLSCDFKTPQKLNLIKHMASKHGQDVDGKLLELDISCELCDFKCIAEHMLKNHVLRKHTQKSAMRYHCTESDCNYATVEKAALDKHMRFKHTNERPFMCDTVSKCAI